MTEIRDEIEIKRDRLAFTAPVIERLFGDYSVAVFVGRFKVGEIVHNARSGLWSLNSELSDCFGDYLPTEDLRTLKSEIAVEHSERRCVWNSVA